MYTHVLRNNEIKKLVIISIQAMLKYICYRLLCGQDHQIFWGKTFMCLKIANV